MAESDMVSVPQGERLSLNRIQNCLDRIDEDLQRLREQNNQVIRLLEILAQRLAHPRKGGK